MTNVIQLRPPRLTRRVLEPHHETLAEIVAEYAPYNAHPAFGAGFVAYEARHFTNPYELDSVAAQAWDRGANAAMRYETVKKQGGKQ